MSIICTFSFYHNAFSSLANQVNVEFFTCSLVGYTKQQNFGFSKLKTFADVTKLALLRYFNLFFERVENIVGKGENAGYQHFLLFPQRFRNASFSAFIKTMDCHIGMQICFRSSLRRTFS